jgi:RsiW-degrading membrane proteinase PrsW (M82 family)
LKTRDEAAGKKGKCPSCGQMLVIPWPEPAAFEPPPDEFGLTDPPMEDALPAPPTMPERVVRYEQPALGGGVSSLRHYVYFLLLLALLPLVMSTLKKNDDVGRRLKHTLEANKSIVEKFERQEDASFDDLLNALPNHRIEGALLPRNTWTHWLFAGLSAAGFFGLMAALFPGAVRSAKNLVLVGVFTGTLGILFLLAVQFIADWTQGWIVTGRSIIVLLFYVVKLIGLSYRLALGDTNFWLSFLGFTCGVGLCEELCKALPLLWHYHTQDTLGWRGALLWGLASGIGFGVSEGITYSSEFYNGVLTGDIYVVRFVSCVALHAMWAAAAGIVLFRVRGQLDENWIGTVLAAIGLPMVLHGLYDTFLKKNMHLLALATAVATFVWMAWQIESVRRKYAEEEDEEDVEAAVA